MSESQKNYWILKRRGSVHQFQQAEKTKLLRRGSFSLDKDLQGREEIWNQREMDCKKSITRITLHKRDEIETLILIILFFFIFLSALYVAPNQFYRQGNNK